MFWPGPLYVKKKKQLKFLMGLNELLWIIQNYGNPVQINTDPLMLTLLL